VNIVITDGRSQKAIYFSADSTQTPAAIGDSIIINYNDYYAMRDTVTENYSILITHDDYNAMRDTVIKK
jgi:hypothetical protein